MIKIILFWIAIILLCWWLLHKLFMVPKHGCLALITGAVKAGKSTFAVHLSIKAYKKAVWNWRFYTYFVKPVFGWLPFLRSKLPARERPLYYSNVPIAVDGYSPLTADLLLRKKRFRYGSVVYVNEASLVADSMLIKNMDINERIALFNKLFGHETKGGCLFYDTQSVLDNHFGVKRNIASYFHVHHNIKIPFFVIMWVREMFYSDDGSIINTAESTAEDSLKMVIIPKKIWKQFDAYCFSYFTDDLPVADTVVKYEKGGDLKVKKIVSFRKFKSLKKEFVENENDEAEN